jgi:serine/threonine-protein kinase
MDTDRNLLFGVLALQADLIDCRQFVEACTLWTTRKGVPLAEVLVERGWILPADKAHVDYLLQRKLQRHDGDVRASLAAVPDDLRRSLAALGDPDIRQSLAGPPNRGSPLAATVDHVPGPAERYTRTRLHATGGIGRVWLARDGDLGRDVALKELRPERADDPAFRARFLQEAQITGQLEHPGIVPVYELARRPDDRQPFYTMRFIRGRTLSEAAAAYHRKRAAGEPDPLDLVGLLNAFVTVCNTVAYAHSRGVLHRDLKGENIVLGDFGEVVVLDWGLAKLQDRPDGEPGAPVVALDDGLGSGSGGTVQGQALGTPAYMAPEQASGRPDLIDCRTDVHGLGAVLYEILTGRPPFTGPDTKAVLRRVCEEDPAPPRQLNPEAPPALEAVCLRALAKRPAGRYGSAVELAQEVQGWQDVQRREAEEERDRFFTLSVDMFCTAGFDGYFTRLNPAWERTLGFTVEEMLAEPFLSFVHPDDHAATLAEMAKLGTGADTISFENRYRCKDGSYRWLSWTAKPVLGRQRIYAAARDITQRKWADEALRESEQRYRSVIAAMQEGIVLFDADGTILACNASAQRILGLSAEQLTGRTARDPRWRAVREDGSPFPEEAFPVLVTLRTGEPCADVVMGVHKPDDTLTWISINSQPLVREGETSPYAVVTTFSDVTRRKHLEEELRRTTAELVAARRQSWRSTRSPGSEG